MLKSDAAKANRTGLDYGEQIVTNKNSQWRKQFLQNIMLQICIQDSCNLLRKYLSHSSLYFSFQGLICLEDS